ncbi:MULTISPECIES: hypothetical protein [Salinibaculum]|uniref:hypothetical protein n=1 Tax=Salinibaculum TaxID=2732368 RepID=UPI0030CC64E1
MARASFIVEDDLDSQVENRLVAGQSKASWYRYSVETIMACDILLDDLYEPYQHDERREFIEEAVAEKIEREKENNGF